MSDGTERMKEQADAFAKMWTDFASKMGAPGFAFRPGEPPSEAARQMRDALFEVMSKYSDQFLRSPEFLQQLKQSFDGAIEFRKQLNALLTQLHHETQGVSLQDVRALQQAIDDLRHRLVDRVDRISERLDAIESRLNATVGKSAPVRRKASGRAKKASAPRGSRSSASRKRGRK